jgi:hypothetical protein
MAEEMSIYGVKSLSKEQRRAMNGLYRKDPSLWDAVNGIGGLSESSPNGLIIGNVFNNSGEIQGADVSIEDINGDIITRKTNQYGHYEAELSPGDYNVTVTIDGVSSDPKTITLIAGATELYTFNPEDVKPPEPPEEPAG